MKKRDCLIEPNRKRHVMRLRNPSDGSEIGIISLPSDINDPNGDLYVSHPVPVGMV